MRIDKIEDFEKKENNGKTLIVIAIVLFTLSSVFGLTVVFDKFAKGNGLKYAVESVWLGKEIADSNRNKLLEK